MKTNLLLTLLPATTVGLRSTESPQPSLLQFDKSKALADMDGFTQYYNCEDGSETCEYQRLLLQQQVKAGLADMKDNSLLRPRRLTNDAADGVKRIQNSLVPIVKAMSAPSAANGLSDSVKTFKQSLADIAAMIKKLTTEGEDKILKSKISNIRVVNAFGADFQAQLDAYQTTVGSAITQLNKQTVTLASEQTDTFGSSAARASAQVEASVGGTGSTIAAAKQGADDADDSIIQSVAKTSKSLDDAPDDLMGAIGVTQNQTAAVLEAQSTALAHEADTASAKIDKEADKATGLNQKAASGVAVTVSKALGETDKAMTGIVSDLSSAVKDGVTAVVQATKAAENSATVTLGSATRESEGGVDQLTNGFDSVSADARKSLDDASELVAGQQGQFSEISSDFSSASATLENNAGTLAGNSESTARRTVENAEQSASGEVQRQNGKLATVAASNSAAIQSAANGALSAASTAAASGGLDAASADDQLSGAQKLLGVQHAELGGRVETTIGAATGRLSQGTASAQTALEKLLALLQGLTSQSARNTDSAKSGIQSATSSAAQEAQARLAASGNSAADALGSANSKLAERASGMQSKIEGVPDVISGVGESASASQSGLDQANEQLRQNQKSGENAIANVMDQVGALSESGAAAISYQQNQGKAKITEMLNAVSQYESAVKQQLKDQVNSQVSALSQGGSTTQALLAQNTAAVQEMIAGTQANLATASALKAQLEKQLAIADQATQSAAQGASQSVSSDFQGFIANFENSFAEHSAGVQTWLGSFIQKQLQDADASTGSVSNSTSQAFDDAEDLVTSVLVKASDTKKLVDSDLTDVSLDKSNLAAETKEVLGYFKATRDRANAGLDQAYDGIQNEIEFKNQSMNATFSDLTKKAANVSNLVKNAGVTMFKTVAAQQLQIDDFISQLKSAMQLAQLQDAEAQRSEMAAQLAKLNQSDSAIAGTQKEVEAATSAAAKSSNNQKNEIKLIVGGLAESGSQGKSDNDLEVTASTGALVGAGNVAHEGAQAVDSEIDSGEQDLKENMESNAEANRRRLEKAESGAGADTANIQGESKSAAELWERRTQEALYTVGGNTESVAAIFRDLSAMNDTVLDDVSSMLQAIHDAFGSVLDKVDGSTLDTADRFARVQDVVAGFGQLVEGFLSETRQSMETLRAESSDLSNTVETRLSGMDQRVIESNRWIGTGMKDAETEQKRVMAEVQAMQSELQNRAQSVKDSMVTMRGSLRKALTDMDDRLAQGSNTIRDWSSGLSKDVNDWLTAASADSAQAIIKKVAPLSKKA